MMKKVVLTIAVMIMLLLGGYARADFSWIANGSFEYDGGIENIKNEMPFGWYDVDIPSDFSGAVSSSWASDGNYNLTFLSDMLGEFEPDDIATISQYVYLSDVNEIIFDIKLETNPSFDSWDPTKRSAVIKIDDDIVWNSSSLGTGDLSGEYFDLVVDVSEMAKYKDGQRHLLSLGLRSNTSESWPFIEYSAKWDYLRFNTHCQGYGYLEGDFDHDCFVDVNDLKLFVDHWLDDVEDFNDFDLYYDNKVAFSDYAIFANNWMSNSYGQDAILEYDLNLDGIVNFADFAIKAQQWQAEGIDFDELEAFVDKWLTTNWMYGLE
ncbi:hypothetical protein ACFL1G_08355 [Planctomycetota bacterium]